MAGRSKEPRLNRLHALALIQKIVLDKDITDLDEGPKQVFNNVREVVPIGGKDEVLSRAEVMGFAKQAIATAATAKFPVERANLRLEVAEHELRADLLDALCALDITDPADCRDVFNVHRELAGSSGPASMRTALDALSAGGVDVTAYTVRLEALYPKPKAEDDTKVVSK